MVFHDYTSQETPILTIGYAELLYKNNKKILRFKKSTHGTEDDIVKYDTIKDLIKGRVLDVGLGMGNSVDMILSVEDVTELIVYEIENDIIQVYEQTHDSDERLIIENKNAFDHKPTGLFDVILYELEYQPLYYYTEAGKYLDWCKDHLTESGKIILWYKVNSNILAKSLESYSLSYISIPTGLKPIELFIKLLKV